MSIHIYPQPIPFHFEHHTCFIFFWKSCIWVNMDHLCPLLYNSIEQMNVELLEHVYADDLYLVPSPQTSSIHSLYIKLESLFSLIVTHLKNEQILEFDYLARLFCVLSKVEQECICKMDSRPSEQPSLSKNRDDSEDEEMCSL